MMADVADERGAETTCVKCGTALPVTARFCLECGQPVASTDLPTPARDPRAYTPRHLVSRVLHSRAALEGERKQVTVLFVDIQGSTQLSAKLGPEPWHELLDRFFEILTAGVHRYEGTVNQYTGDGIMALFGAPIAHEDHAHRACWAALELRDALRDFARELREDRGLELQVRMGLHSGDVIVGAIGDDLRMDYTAQGYTVGIAARIEQTAAPGSVRVSEKTARHVEGFFRLGERELTELRGVPEPLPLFELLGPGPLRSRLDAARTGARSRWVGRKRERARLDEAAAQALEGYGRVVCVVGDAGVGKTRLCLQLLETCAEQGFAVHAAHCPTHGRSVPYLAISELLRAQLGITPADPERALRQRVEQGLGHLLPDVADAVPVALHLLGVAGQSPRLSSRLADAAERRRSYAALLGRLVQRRSRDGASAIFLDDVHGSDPESEELLADLVQAIGYTRTLLVVTQRPNDAPTWLTAPYASVLRLGPLEAADLHTLLADLLGSDPSTGPLLAGLAERSGGNPFFAEALVDHLAATGAIAGARGQYHYAGDARDAARIELPEAIRTLLAARLDRLPERRKRALERAAVIGRSFSEPLLREVLARDDEALAPELEALLDTGLLALEAELPERRLGFRHPQLQEVAYTAQVATRQREGHAAVAAALEEVYRDRLGEQAALIAHHWESAGRPYPARRWRQRAALLVSHIQIRRHPTGSGRSD
jgi:class 3 adenylate cyclase